MARSRYIVVLLGPRTSCQPPALTEKHVRNVCHTAH